MKHASRHVAWTTGYAWLLLVGVNSVRADGGVVRAVVEEAGLKLTVLTSPTPWRVGWVEVSVLAQDAATGREGPSGTARVRLRSRANPLHALEGEATREASSNVLFHAALFELPEEGEWDVEVEFQGVRTAFVERAFAPLPAWLDLAWWIALPFLGFGLYAWHVWLTGRSPPSPSFRRS